VSERPSEKTSVRKLASESWREKGGVRKLSESVRKLASEGWRQKVCVRKVASERYCQPVQLEKASASVVSV